MRFQASLDGDLSVRQRTILYGTLAVLLAAAYLGAVLEWPPSVMTAAAQESLHGRRVAISRALVMLERLINMQRAYAGPLEVAMRRIVGEVGCSITLPEIAEAVLEAIRRAHQGGRR